MKHPQHPVVESLAQSVSRIEDPMARHRLAFDIADVCQRRHFLDFDREAFYVVCNDDLRPAGPAAR